MGSFVISSWVVVVFCCLLRRNGGTHVEKCPSNCICYPDVLSNLASWEWVEPDIHSNPNNPNDKEFNPYTEHNEVYDAPQSVNFLRTAEIYNTVTCILRTDLSVVISETFSEIPANTQVLSILQGAGSGNITLNRFHLEPLTELIGIDIQGYRDGTSDFLNRANSFRLAADALLPLRKLTYLNLNNVLLQQRSVEPPPKKYVARIVSLRKPGTPYNNTYEGSEVLSNLESQLIFLGPQDSKPKEPIVPYSVYKSRFFSSVNGKRESETKTKTPEPKVAVAFTGIPSLLHLRISECNMQDISWDMFHQLHSLKFLLLERNDLLFLPDFVFFATSNLTTLSLSGNRILSLETVGLAGLLYLQKLDMTHNNITHLSELSLPPFPHLEVADFRHNPIEAIFPNTFEVMNTTKSLYLGSPLVSLQIFPNSFFGLANLVNLEITNIRIEFLERPMFKDLHNLKSLIMDGQIRKISYDAFSEVPQLERLNLKNCKIEKISMDAFIGLTSLIELDLSYNRITFLPPAIFDDQFSLREIYLQHNELTTLPPNLFSRTPIKMIRLEANPWHCSCDMATWNPGKINQIRSYYIPTNDTLCQREFYKGKLCRSNTPKGFAVKYIYEKRVSPACVTPKKFSQRNVFDVMRKELQYCSTSVVSTPSLVVKPKVKFGKGVKSATKFFKAHGKYQNIIKAEKVRKINLRNHDGQELNETGYIISAKRNPLIVEAVTQPITTIHPVELRESSTTIHPLELHESSRTMHLSELHESPTTMVPTKERKFTTTTVPPETYHSTSPPPNVTNIITLEVTTELVPTHHGVEESTENSNDVVQIPAPIPHAMFPQFSLKAGYRQFESLRSAKSKYGTTPPPLKPITRNVLPLPSRKSISKKALKLSKLYGTQRNEQSH